VHHRHFRGRRATARDGCPSRSPQRAAPRQSAVATSQRKLQHTAVLRNTCWQATRFHVADLKGGPSTRSTPKFRRHSARGGVRASCLLVPFVVLGKVVVALCRIPAHARRVGTALRTRRIWRWPEEMGAARRRDNIIENTRRAAISSFRAGVDGTPFFAVAGSRHANIHSLRKRTASCVMRWNLQTARLGRGPKASSSARRRERDLQR